VTTTTVTVRATATVPSTVQTALTTPATTVVPSAVEGEVLSRTGTNTVPFMITGVELVLLGTALERNARRRSTLPALTLQPVQTVRITDILREVARARQAAAVAAQARTSDLTSARREPRTRDIGAWRRYRG
jgi:hypothetical protein